MRVNDYFLYAKTIVVNNKLRTIISIIISIVLSFVVSFMLLLSVNYSNNFSKLEREFLNGISIDLSVNGDIKDFDSLIEIGRKYNVSDLSIQKGPLFLRDFYKDFDGTIVDGISLNIGTYGVITNVNDKYKVGDKYYDIDFNEYEVIGLYKKDSNDFNLVYADLTATKKILNKTNLNYEFHYTTEDFLNNYNNFKELRNYLDNNRYNYSKPSGLENYLNLHNNIYISVCFLFLISIVLFISMIGFLANSIAMSFSECSSFFDILNNVGARKKDLIIIINIYILSITLISILISSIFLFTIYNRINYNTIYSVLIPPSFRKGIKESFGYDTSFPFYLPFITFVFFLFYSFIHIVILVKKRFK